MRRFLLIGDSITVQGFQIENSGWVSALMDHYSHKIDLINRGQSGYNSRWLLALLKGTSEERSKLVPLWFLPVDLVTIFLGANDAALPGEYQHVPVAEFKSNLTEMCQILDEKCNVPRIVLMNPPPVDEVAWRRAVLVKWGTDVQTRSHSLTQQYAAAVSEVASSWSSSSKCSVVMCDVNTEILRAPLGYEKCLHDGLHLNQIGNRIVCDALLQTIATSFGGDLACTAIQQPIPHHSIFNPSLTAAAVPK